MSISSYNDLITEIDSAGKRRDLLIDIPRFIRMTEARLDRVLNLRSMEGRWETNLKTDDRFAPLPPGYIRMRTLRIYNEGGYLRELRYATPEALPIENGKGMPAFYSVTNEIAFDCIPDKNYLIEMCFHEKLEPLSTENQTNKVLDLHPDLYLYGALVHYYIFARDEATANIYDQIFSRILGEIEKIEKRSRRGSAAAMQFEGATP